MTPEQLQAITELIEAARPFLDTNIVDETSGTLPLMDRLKQAIEQAEEVCHRAT